MGLVGFGSNPDLAVAADRANLLDHLAVTSRQVSLERRCQCGISQKDGFAGAFMDGGVMAPERRHEASLGYLQKGANKQ
jgi:hypothetical protein